MNLPELIRIEAESMYSKGLNVDRLAVLLSRRLNITKYSAEKHIKHYINGDCYLKTIKSRIRMANFLDLLEVPSESTVIKQIRLHCKYSELDFVYPPGHKSIKKTN